MLGARGQGLCWYESIWLGVGMGWGLGSGISSLEPDGRAFMPFVYTDFCEEPRVAVVG